MSEEANVEVATEAKAPAKPKTEYTAVTMRDGRAVQFAGNRQADKTIVIEGEEVTVRIDFRSGDTVSLKASEMPAETQLKAKGHGMSQKLGDEYADQKKVEDMVLAAESMAERLRKGEWSVARAAGDSFSGASIVIKAIVEVTGKTVEEVKNFLSGKLEKAKAAGEALSRKELYDSFRNPNSKTGVVIERLEREERSKSSKVDANELLAEVEGA